VRRYTIDADWRATWVLVSNGRDWYVKRLGLHFSRLDMSVEAFEQSPSGRRLSFKFEAAVLRATQEAQPLRSGRLDRATDISTFAALGRASAKGQNRAVHAPLVVVRLSPEADADAAGYC
jgi:hypothetical protein